MSGHSDDLLMLGVLADGPRARAEELAARCDDRRVDSIRVTRWLSSAKERELVESEIETDPLGRAIGPRLHSLTDKGARLLNELSRG